MAKKPQQISSFKPDTDIQGYFLVTEKSIRKTRTGDPYLDMILQDETGRISAKMWQGFEEQAEEIAEGDAVVVKGHTDLYRNKLQLNVSKISKVREEHTDYGFSPDSLIASSSRDPLEMFEEVKALIESVEDEFLKELLNLIYDENRERIMSFPAAKFIHHNFRSGLLEHTLSIANDASYFAKKYPDLNRDLLLAGSLLHDIGKVEELTGEIATAYTDEGNLVGHIILGRDMVREASKKIDGFPKETLLLLDHMILSHQGKYEYASPRRPMIKEALLLYHIDEMDAKLNIFDKALEEDENDREWTDSNNYFGVPLYKGNRRKEKQ